ncbi:MAG: hypothetical protein ACRBDL_04270 [Alphaproteobacteria bacterium]
MTNLIDLIAEYKKEGMDKFITRPNLSEIISDIRSGMDGCPPSDEQEIRDFLQNVDSYISQHIQNLKGDVEQGKLNVSRVQENSKACIAYLDTARKGMTKRKR